MKYRLKKQVNKNTKEVRYVCQEKFLFWWVNMYEYKNGYRSRLLCSKHKHVAQSYIDEEIKKSGWK